MFEQDPTRCRHNVIDYNKIDHFRTELYCKRCGEVVGWLEDLAQKADTYITGEVRKLTTKERSDLR